MFEQQRYNYGYLITLLVPRDDARLAPTRILPLRATPINTRFLHFRKHRLLQQLQRIEVFPIENRKIFESALFALSLLG